MTDNEIVKAWIVVLENKRMPTEYLINVTIDRINSLTAEVLRQQAEINVKNRLLDEAKAEIERLEKPISASAMFQIAEASVEKAEKFIAEIKSEAYREFAERLKKEIDIRPTHSRKQNEYVCFLINNLLKELVGEEN